MVPTRELAVQVHSVIAPLLKHAGLPSACILIGGVSYAPQMAGLRKKPSVIIATPGRLLDHLQQGFKLDTLRTLVLDEADRMLDMGFAPQVMSILRYVPADRQTMLFTATISSDLQKIIRNLLRNPEQVAVDAPSTANADIDQKTFHVSQDGKNNALLDIVNKRLNSILIFARTKRRTDKIATFLETYGVKAERIHGDRSQSQRQRAIDSFRSGRVKILVATDIAARGLDIPLVELVGNFDLPEGRDDYVHRIGRTGRAGAKGEALSFVCPDENKQWAEISGAKRDNSSKPGYSRAARGSRPYSAPRSADAARSDSRPASRPSEGNRPFSGGRDHADNRQQNDSRPDARRPESGGRFAVGRGRPNARPRNETRSEDGGRAKPARHRFGARPQSSRPQGQRPSASN
jgi:ATP-dependent RNA helicase RhlE